MSSTAPEAQVRCRCGSRPSEQEIQALFSAWREELLDCRKYAPTARNYAAARLMADVGLRLNEVRSLDLADVKWDLGRFGKLHVRLLLALNVDQKAAADHNHSQT
jgi:integrase